MLTQDVREEIRQKLDLAALAGEYIPRLERAGSRLKGLCPFHAEKTPSFFIHPERQMYRCFGCGEGGDVFDFIMKIENLSFPEAIERLAAKAGVTITRALMTGRDRERQAAKESLAFAARFYHEFLLGKEPAAETARKYLESRRVSVEMIKRFSLGYAPGGGRLLKALAAKGTASEAALRAGVVVKPPAGGAVREYFFNRVIFPIRDAKGEVAGFGGRVLGDGEPKYLNSADSSFFSKRRVLYGLWEGLKVLRNAKTALLMEGYLDVIAAHQAGFENAVAPLGTAFSPEHAQLLKRYVSSVVIVFDSDEAGTRASLRAADILVEAGLSLKIAQVPLGKDPDEFLKTRGAESFREVLASAQDFVEFKIGVLSKGRAALSPEEKSAISREIIASINRSPDEVLKDEWTRRLSQRLSVSEAAVRREAGRAARGASAQASPAAPAVAVAASPLDPDRSILLFILQEPTLAEGLRPADFTTEKSRRLWEELLKLKPYESGWPARLLGALAGEDRQAASALIVASTQGFARRPEEELFKILRRRRAQARVRELESLLFAPGRSRAADPRLQEEYHQALRDLKGTGK